MVRQPEIRMVEDFEVLPFEAEPPAVRDVFTERPVGIHKHRAARRVLADVS